MTLTPTLLYCLAGLVGSLTHWFKKRYIDKTTKDSLVEYITGNFAFTVYAWGSIFMAEATLASTLTGPITLVGLIGAATLGFTLDSGINRPTDRAVVVAAVDNSGEQQ